MERRENKYEGNRGEGGTVKELKERFLGLELRKTLKVLSNHSLTVREKERNMEEGSKFFLINFTPASFSFLISNKITLSYEIMLSILSDFDMMKCYVNKYSSSKGS